MWGGDGGEVSQLTEQHLDNEACDATVLDGGLGVSCLCAWRSRAAVVIFCCRDRQVLFRLFVVDARAMIDKFWWARDGKWGERGNRA